MRSIPTAEDRRVAKHEAAGVVRGLMEEDGVRRVTVRDTHGHTLIEVPVRPAEVGVVTTAVEAAVHGLTDTVGDVVLRVEKEGELPPEGGTRAGMRERERAEARRQATGGETASDVTRAEVAGAPANVTRTDVERIEQANAVPEGDEAAVERIAPEQEGNPELKDTDTPFAADEPRRPRGKPSR